MGMMELLTVREVAAYLKTTRQQVRRMIQCGELRAVKVGRGVPHHPGRLSGVSGGVGTATIQQSTPARMVILAGDFFWFERAPNIRPFCSEFTKIVS